MQLIAHQGVQQKRRCRQKRNYVLGLWEVVTSFTLCKISSKQWLDCLFSSGRFETLTSHT